VALLVVHDVMALIIRSLPLSVLQWLHFKLEFQIPDFKSSSVRRYFYRVLPFSVNKIPTSNDVYTKVPTLERKVTAIKQLVRTQLLNIKHHQVIRIQNTATNDK